MINQGIQKDEIVVPSADSADNSYMMDVIGNKTDTHDGDSLLALSHSLEEHVHKPNKVYPTLANGVTVTGAAGAWTLGNFAEVVPASTITEDFDIHYITVEGASASDVYEIVLYAATTEIGRARVAFVDIANSQTLPSIPFQCAIQPANTQIQAKVASSGGGSDTITISVHYHEY